MPASVHGSRAPQIVQNYSPSGRIRRRQWRRCLVRTNGTAATTAVPTSLTPGKASDSGLGSLPELGSAGKSGRAGPENGSGRAGSGYPPPGPRPEPDPPQAVVRPLPEPGWTIAGREITAAESREIDRIAIQLETFIEEFSNILQRNVGAPAGVKT